jgi:hypothetical protein
VSLGDGDDVIGHRGGEADAASFRVNFTAGELHGIDAPSLQD